MIKKLAEILYHFFFGIYSNIPVCCVCYFIKWKVFKKSRLTALETWLHRHPNKNREDYEIRDRSNHCSYVRCDSCWYNKRANKLKLGRPNSISFRLLQKLMFSKSNPKNNIKLWHF